MKILIAEDDAALALVLDDLLSGQHNLVFAKDGEAALEKALVEVPDLILSDVRMPKLSGPEWVAEYTKTHPDARVIYMSGSDIVPGKYPTIEKPFRIERIRNVISDVEAGIETS
jgi:DNA-binding NtrC family response regulator